MQGQDAGKPAGEGFSKSLKRLEGQPAADGRFDRPKDDE
jgi:hypothetical protein